MRMSTEQRRRHSVGLTSLAGSAALVAVGAVMVALLAGASGAATTAAPTNTGEPAITGTPRVGEVLRTTRGTWTGTAPITYTIRWRRCDGAGKPDASDCARITNATAATYVVRQADAGFRIRSQVIATNAEGSSLAASNATQVITSASPTNTTEPTISGTAVVDNTLTANRGAWVGIQPITYSFRWLRCSTAGDNCSEIDGATDNQYLVVANDVGRTLRVRVTARNDQGSRSAISAQTIVVKSNAAPLTNTARPTITGDARVGQGLTASEGSWTGNPTSFAFQWQRCDVDSLTCANVIGATGRAYGVRIADLGFRLRVAVTARTGGRSGTATSNATATVVPTAPITNRRPTLGIISIRFTGARVYARVRICDDTARNLAILVTESRPGVASANRRFATRVPPKPCGAYTRSWVPAPRFRGSGRYTITLRARDTSGLTSAPARRTFRR